MLETANLHILQGGWIVRVRSSCFNRVVPGKALLTLSCAEVEEVSNSGEVELMCWSCRGCHGEWCHDCHFVFQSTSRTVVHWLLPMTIRLHSDRIWHCSVCTTSVLVGVVQATEHQNTQRPSPEELSWLLEKCSIFSNAQPVTEIKTIQVDSLNYYSILLYSLFHMPSL